MKHPITLIIIAMAATSAHADSWTSKDKLAHAIAGAAVGGITTIATDKASWGCAAAVTVGALKEAYDSMHPDKHAASWKDFAVTAVGGCVAAEVTGLIITPNRVTYSVSANFF